MTLQESQWLEELEVSVLDLCSISVALYSFAFCLSSQGSPIRELSPAVLHNCYQTLKNYLLQHAQETTSEAGFFLKKAQP